MELQATYRQSKISEMKNGEQTLNSLEVSEMVQRRHDQVLRDISNIIGHLSTERKSVVSDYFVETSYKDKTGRILKSYKLTKKGCELYATRMTGAKGTKFAVAYIDRFNDMEQQLLNSNRPSYEISDPVERAKKWIEEQQKLIEAENKIDLLTHSGKLYTATEIGVELGISAQKLNAFLVLQDVQWKVNGTWVFKGKYKDKGYTSTKQSIKNEKTIYHTLFTESGRQFILDLYNNQAS